MATRYSHFCPVARTLEKIGDKWSLLIVRDLLEGPQRFTDLLTGLSNITPKWLTLRLRELEAGGIVERDCQSGRREVWYRLTPAGGDLRPLIETLFSWGQRYAMRPPLPGEVVNSERLMKGLAKWLNKRDKQLSHPAVYAINFPQRTYLLSFAGDEWTSAAGDASDADIKINTTPETIATFTTVQRNERREIFESMRVMGVPRRINEFKKIFSVPDADEKKQTHKQNARENKNE